VSAVSSTEDEGNPNYQGWLPDRNSHEAASIKDGPAEGNSSATATAASSTEDEGNQNYQGWLPAGNSLKAVSTKSAPAGEESAAAANAPADSAPDKDEGNSNFQGYMPDWTPPEPGKSIRDAIPVLPGAAIGVHRQ
jgi:hypothetical protein